MSHLIQDNFQVNDQSWRLGVFITDFNISRDVYVRGDTSIGTVMTELVRTIEQARDWSNHGLWWPDRRKWLKHTRSTLDQVGITAATYLEFTPERKQIR